ncbi:hypothetical protein PBOI14_51050 [Pseudomonas sp. Boi14]|nr:hypothetical protein PBOI14_51050 [Pseudomonas sp. Boi14]
MDAAPTAAEHEVIPVAVQLETRKPRTMGLGLGYSTDVGPRVKANWTRHWVNPRATVTAGRQKFLLRGRTSACGTTFPWTRL